MVSQNEVGPHHVARRLGRDLLLIAVVVELDHRLLHDLAERLDRTREQQLAQRRLADRRYCTPQAARPPVQAPSRAMEI